MDDNVVYVGASNNSTSCRWFRFAALACTLAFFISCISIYVDSHVSLENVPRHAIDSAGMWSHDEFHPKRIWLRGTASIHSPAEEAVDAALHEVQHVRFDLLCSILPGMTYFCCQANVVLGRSQTGSNTKKSSQTTRVSHSEAPIAAPKASTSPQLKIIDPTKSAAKPADSNLPDRHEAKSWLSEQDDVSSFLKQEGNEVVLPSSLDRNSPAALAAAASEIAKAASEVADQSQQVRQESSLYPHYVVFKPAQPARTAQDSIDTFSADSSSDTANSGRKQTKLDSIERKLNTLETVVIGLAQSLKPSSPHPAVASAASLPARSPAWAAHLERLAQSAGAAPVGTGATHVPSARAGLREEGADGDGGDSLEAMQARYQAEGSLNPEADAAIEKVLHDLAKAAPSEAAASN